MLVEGPEPPAGARCGEVRCGTAAVVNIKPLYGAIRKPEDPPTFDKYLATRDPFTATKVSINMIVKVFDNEILGGRNRRRPIAVPLPAIGPRRRVRQSQQRRRIGVFTDQPDEIVRRRRRACSIAAVACAAASRHRPQLQPVSDRARAPICLGARPITERLHCKAYVAAHGANAVPQHWTALSSRSLRRSNRRAGRIRGCGSQSLKRPLRARLSAASYFRSVAILSCKANLALFSASKNGGLVDRKPLEQPEAPVDGPRWRNAQR
jgi:hypothetical protein